VKEARAAAELAYKAQMAVAATISPPLTDAALAERHLMAERSALALFHQLLFSSSNPDSINATEQVC
jgi:hypothetical protein